MISQKRCTIIINNNFLSCLPKEFFISSLVLKRKTKVIFYMTLYLLLKGSIRSPAVKLTFRLFVCEVYVRYMLIRTTSSLIIKRSPSQSREADNFVNVYCLPSQLRVCAFFLSKTLLDRSSEKFHRKHKFLSFSLSETREPKNRQSPVSFKLL